MPAVNWDPSVFRKHKLVISPSQKVNFLECPRRWWFDKVVRVPDLKASQSQFTYGNVVHSCAERFLLADDSGRDVGGNPVDIFPEGWEQDENDGTQVSPREQAQIRKLIQEGIEAGVLRRLRNRRVEWAIDKTIIPGQVAIIGVIDQYAPGIIEDHKTTSASRWALSPRQLAKDAKMLDYAAMVPDDEVTLRLNYFCKDESARKRVWHVESHIHEAQIAKHWEDTCETAVEMLDLKGAKTPEESWQEVEGPRVHKACEKFGGCTYRDICGGLTTPEKVREKFKAMSKLKKKTKKPAPVAEKAPSLPSEAPTPSEEPQAPEGQGEQKETPPWAQAGCNACSGTGINSKGNPCRACDVVSSRTGGRTSSEFKTWHDEAGNLRWSESDGAAPVEKTPAPKTAAKKAAKKKTTKKAEPSAEKSVVVTQDEAVGEAAPEEVAVKWVQMDAGFTLYVNSVPLRAKYVDLAEVFQREGQELAEAWGKASYYECEPFKRLDALVSKAAVVAEEFKGQPVVAMGNGHEFKAYVDAFRPLAGFIVVGTF